ncbi:hypothetical protein SPLC1_S102750 [Arthrospira platensis C1]|nr:hypothetical protein SPLC1_S102750 [Arthrospira platensis C1]
MRNPVAQTNLVVTRKLTERNRVSLGVVACSNCP